MSKQRLEAFTDGVIAVIITIMVLDMKVPQGGDFAALRSACLCSSPTRSVSPTSAFFGITITTCSMRPSGLMGWFYGRICCLLFWMSLVPFVIRWMDDTHFASSPTAAYGVVLVLCAVSYLLLERAIIKCNGPNSKLARAVGKDTKGKLSLSIYVLAIPLAFVHSWIALALYVAIALYMVYTRSQALNRSCRQIIERMFFHGEDSIHK